MVSSCGISWIFQWSSSTLFLAVASTSLCFWVLVWVVVYKLWLGPIRIQRIMAAQGIKGHPYRFLHGSIKDIYRLRKEAAESSAVALSHDIFPRVHPHIHTWINTYGTIYLNWYGPEAQLVVAEPELIKEVLNNKNGVFTKIGPRGFVKKLLGGGIVLAEGEKWAKLRKLANHAFHGEILKGSVPAMVDSVYMMLERLKQKEGKEVEMYEEFRLLTSEVISRTAFGSSYVEGRNIFDKLQELGLLTSRNVLKLRFPGMSKIWKTDDEVEAEKLERGIRDSILEIIKKREEKAAAGHGHGEEVDGFGSEYLGFLLKALKDEDKSNRITLDDSVDECKTFYFAGQETTNSLLTWTVFLLAVHTDWQEEARTEVLSTFGHQAPNFDGILKLKTMTMILNESLRLYPPVTSILRKTERETRLGKLLLPANMTILISNLKLHHDPHIWGDDVHLFKPERFSEGIAKATNNNMGVYLPFGMGPRNCVGMNFATTEAKIALSMILQRYSFTLSPAYVHSPVHILTTRPQHGLHVIFHPLSKEKSYFP